jgi:hypothetical protein
MTFIFQGSIIVLLDHAYMEVYVQAFMEVLFVTARNHGMVIYVNTEK